ncbi:MAG: DUF2145 domain-containing protein [Rhodospirillaceae bacterium]|nr:DUF2145 domain-containing protein [Rhodospirillaceae bacterium]
MKRWLAAILLLLALPASAGQTCEEQDLSPEMLRQAFDLALETRKALDESGARVAILARAGQDLSKWGLSWSHAGLVVRDHPAGRWIVVHELNDCGTAESAIYDEGLANFFADFPIRWEGLLITPTPDVQEAMLRALANGMALRLHEKSYNMVAYPFSARYQNSNQWLLEMVAAGLGGGSVSNRVQAQQWLRANGYVPTSLNIPALTRLGARAFRANVAFDDHPPEQRWADRIDTVTVESIVAFMERGRAVKRSVRAVRP